MLSGRGLGHRLGQHLFQHVEPHQKSTPSIYRLIALRHGKPKRWQRFSTRSLARAAEPSQSQNDARQPLGGQPAGDQSSPPKRSRYGLPLLVAVISGFAAYTLTPTSSDPSSFQPHQLVSRVSISSTASLFKIQPTKSNPIPEPPANQIFSVEFKQPYLQIGRDYTPLPKSFNHVGDNIKDDGTLTFLVRKAPSGEMSKYLFTLPLGTKLDVRGPKEEYTIPVGTKHLIFFAGGTGIAPALQAAEVILSQPRSTDGIEPTIHILWANRQREDCAGAPLPPIPSPSPSWLPSWLSSPSTPSPPTTLNVNDPSPLTAHLTNLQSLHPHRLQISYFIDSESTYITPSVIKSAVSNTTSPSTSPQRQTKETQILISGPEPFISYVAGPKGVDGSQGPLGGVLSSLIQGGKVNDGNGVGVWKL